MIGLEPDLARELATELSRGLTFHEYDFEELIPALRDGEIDVIMSGMTATPLRALRIGFTHSYLSIGQRLLVRARDAEVYASAELVRTAGARIGVLKSTTGEQYARARLAPAPVRTYGNLTDAADDLAAGSLDVVVSDAPIVSALASSREPGTLVVVGELLTHESLAWGVRKEDVELRHQLDAALERMRADGRLASIANRWLPAMH